MVHVLLSETAQTGLEYSPYDEEYTSLVVNNLALYTSKYLNKI